MSEKEPTSRVYLWIWQTGPGQWMASHPASGLGATGSTRQEAIDLFRHTWNGREDFVERDGAPPRPKREEAPREAITDTDETRATGYAAFRDLQKAVHPDVSGDKMFSATEVSEMITRLWRATQGGK